MVAIGWIYNGFVQLQIKTYERDEKMSSKLLSSKSFALAIFHNRDFEGPSTYDP